MSDHRPHRTPAASRKIDTTPLRNLLQMAGPVAAPDIVTAFLQDLKTTEFGLDQAWNGPDCAAIRLHAHVLIALAGTVGDTDLQVIAQTLNALARDKDVTGIQAIKVQTMRGLAELIKTLATFDPTQV